MSLSLLVWFYLPIPAMTIVAWCWSTVRYGRRAKRTMAGLDRESIAALACARRNSLTIWVAVEHASLLAVVAAAMVDRRVVGIGLLVVGYFVSTRSSLVANVFHGLATGRLSTALLETTWGAYALLDHTRRMAIVRLTRYAALLVTLLVLVPLSVLAARLGVGTDLVLPVPFADGLRSTWWWWNPILLLVAAAAYELVQLLDAAGRSVAMASRVRDVDDGIESAEVIYLRSFPLDEVRVRSRRSQRQPWHRLVLPVVRDHFEDVILWQFWAVGPVSALSGVDGAGATHGGAGRRAPMEHGEWQARLLRLLETAKVVVMVPDSSKGVLWEIQQIRDSAELRAKTIFVLPPAPVSGDDRSPVVPLVTFWEEDREVVLSSIACEDVDYEAAIETALCRLDLVPTPERPTPGA